MHKCQLHCRARFTLSSDLPSPWKNWRPFFSHHCPRVSCQFSWKTDDLFCSLLSFTRGCPLFWYFGHAKNLPLLLWGPLFGQTCWTCLNPPLANCSYASCHCHQISLSRIVDTSCVQLAHSRGHSRPEIPEISKLSWNCPEITDCPEILDIW